MSCGNQIKPYMFKKNITCTFDFAIVSFRSGSVTYTTLIFRKYIKYSVIIIN